ncbi:hypothetical protein Tco_0642729 [Tanacetum coccineum]
MSSNNASSAVTYTSISSDSNGPSWELDEHVPVYVLEPKHPEYHVLSDDDIQVEDQSYAGDASPIAESPGYIADSELMEKDSIDYPDEPKDDDEDPKEDLEEDHTNYPVDREDGDDEPSADDDDDDDTDDEDEEPTEDEEEEHLAPGLSLLPVTVVDIFLQLGIQRHLRLITSMKARIADHVATPIPPTSLAYDQAPLGHREAMIHMRDDIPKEGMPPQRRFVLTAPPPGCDVAESSAAAAARPPRGQYDLVDTVNARHGLIRSPGHDARTIDRAADRVEDVGYLHDARTNCRDIRLEIDVVRGQRTAYETELHKRQRAEDDAIRQMMRIHVLEARAQIDTVEDTGSSSNDAMTPESIQAMIDQEIQRNSTHTQDDASRSSGGGLKRPVQPARVCSYTDFMNCQPLNFKGTKGIVGLSQWLEKMESVFHISSCAIDNQVKFSTCTLLGAALTR